MLKSTFARQKRASSHLEEQQLSHHFLTRRVVAHLNNVDTTFGFSNFLTLNIISSLLNSLLFGLYLLYRGGNFSKRHHTFWALQTQCIAINFENFKTLSEFIVHNNMQSVVANYKIIENFKFSINIKIRVINLLLLD